jgi:hypothetical protein
LSTVSAPDASRVNLPVTPPAVHGRRGVMLLAIGVFQLWLWTTRLVNLVQDSEPRTTAFIVVHAALYGASFGAAGVLVALGWRMRREATSARTNRIEATS